MTDTIAKLIEARLPEGWSLIGFRNRKGSGLAVSGPAKRRFATPVYGWITIDPTQTTVTFTPSKNRPQQKDAIIVAINTAVPGIKLILNEAE